MDTIVLVEGPPLTRRPDRDIRMDATQLYWWEGVRVQIGMLEWIQEDATQLYWCKGGVRVPSDKSS